MSLSYISKRSKRFKSVSLLPGSHSEVFEKDEDICTTWTAFALNVQADLKATTNQLEKTRPTMAYLVAMIRKLRGMIEQLATQAVEINLNPEQQDALTALLNDNETLVERICKKL